MVIVTFLQGCPWGKSDTEISEQEIRAVLNCSAGVFVSYNRSANIETDLRTKIEAGVKADDAVHGYIFELLPPADRLKGYELYLQCIRQPADPNGIDPRLYAAVERSQYLWDSFDEAERLHDAVPLGEADKFAAMAASLKSISDADFNAKSKLKKYDRQALMYFLAAEVLVRSGTSAEDLAGRAVDYSMNAYQAARQEREIYKALIRKGANPVESEWLQSIDVRETILNRLADAQAQLGFLSKDPHYFSELNETLKLLGCEYIVKYRMAQDAMYVRIPEPVQMTACTGGKT